MLRPKKYSFPLILQKIQRGMGRGGGGGGGVTSFTNITGKVPTLLTSIVYPLLIAAIFLTKRSWGSF